MDTFLETKIGRPTCPLTVNSPELFNYFSVIIFVSVTELTLTITLILTLTLTLNRPKNNSGELTDKHPNIALSTHSHQPNWQFQKFVMNYVYETFEGV